MKKFKKLLHLKGNQGFSLVELLIYMGLLTMLVVVFTEIFISITDNQLSSRNTSNVAIDGRYIYSRFIYDVNRAQSIVSPVDFASPSSSLTIVIDGQNYTYSIDNDNLVITEATGSYPLNGEGTKVSSLSFTKVGTTSAQPTIQLNFTVSATTTNHGIIDKEDFQTTAGIR